MQANREVWANECGDLIRLMLVHVGALTTSGATWLTPDKIRIEDEDTGSVSSVLPVASLAAEPASVSMSQASIGSSVHICGAECRCHTCMRDFFIEVDSSQGPPGFLIVDGCKCIG